MGTQGSKTVVLPDDVGKAIERAQNRVSILEAEHVRLNTLVEALKVEANTLESQIEGYKDDLGEQETTLSFLRREIEENKLAEIAAYENKVSAEVEFTGLKKELDDAKDVRAKLKVETDRLNKGTAESRAALIELRAKVDLKKKNIKSFDDAIKSLTKELL